MNKIMHYSKQLLCVAALLLPLASGCTGDDKDNDKSDENQDEGANAPTVTVLVPVDGTIDLPINGKFAAVFSLEMEPGSINATTFTVTDAGGTSTAGTVTYVAASRTATFKPDENLATNSKYTATITAEAKSQTGVGLATSRSWTVTTGATADTTAPTATSTEAADGATDMPINRHLTVVFAEAMDPATVNAATFKVVDADGVAVSGAVTYAGTTATFIPDASLTPNTTYTATLTKDVTDLAGNALASDLVWSFTTSATAALGPSPVALGSAGNYVILAKTSVSTTGVTAIVGNIGLSPAAQSYVTGFSETLDATNKFATAGIVTGKIYAADMAVPTPSDLTTAVSAMETAYTNAAGRSLPDFTELGAGDVSGKTLVPGLYKWGTGVLMSTDVTIAGSENDVWIFQIAQDLTVANGVSITLADGALAKNIFWQVAGQVTLGTTADFQGIILSQTKIVFETGASLNGRALAQTAVTLDANTVTQPAP